MRDPSCRRGTDLALLCSRMRHADAAHSEAPGRPHAQPCSTSIRPDVAALLHEHVAELSHELRRSLTRISTSVQVTELGGADDVDGMRRILASVRDEVRAMGAVLAEWERGTHVASSLVDFGTLCEEAVRAWRVREPDRSVVLRVSPDGHPVLGYRPALERILANLVRNAEQHAPGAPVDLTVRRIGDEQVLTMADDGPGVPRQVRQALAAGEAPPGGRRGLTIVARLVAEHGGSFSLVDRAAGTLLRIGLPALDVTAGDDSVE